MTEFDALLITWAIEIPLLLVFDRFVSGHWRWRALLAGLLASGITHPLAWQTMLAFYQDVPVYALWAAIEICVTLVEMAVYRALLYRQWRWAQTAFC